MTAMSDVGRRHVVVGLRHLRRALPALSTPARRRSTASAISRPPAMTMRRARPSMRACTTRTLCPEGWIRRSRPGRPSAGSLERSPRW